MKKSEELIVENYKTALAKLHQTFDGAEVISIRNAICEWADLTDVDIESKWVNFSDGKKCVYYSKKRDGFFFNTEKETKLFNALVDLSPEQETSKIITAMSIVAKLLDINDINKF